MKRIILITSILFGLAFKATGQADPYTLKEEPGYGAGFYECSMTEGKTIFPTRYQLGIVAKNNSEPFLYFKLFEMTEDFAKVCQKCADSGTFGGVLRIHFQNGEILTPTKCKLYNNKVKEDFKQTAGNAQLYVYMNSFRSNKRDLSTMRPQDVCTYICRVFRTYDITKIKIDDWQTAGTLKTRETLNDMFDAIGRQLNSLELFGGPASEIARNTPTFIDRTASFLMYHPLGILSDNLDELTSTKVETQLKTNTNWIFNFLGDSKYLSLSPGINKYNITWNGLQMDQATLYCSDSSNNYEKGTWCYHFSFKLADYTQQQAKAKALEFVEGLRKDGYTVTDINNDWNGELLLNKELTKGTYRVNIKMRYLPSWDATHLYINVRPQSNK